MQRYAALLRGVNLAGRNRVSMAELRRRLTDRGYAGVTTYLQSGNVVLAAPASGEAALAGALEAELRHGFGLDVTVVIRTGPQLARLASANPWVRPRADPSVLHVTLLASAPTRAAARELEGLPAGADACAVVGRDVYLRCPGGYGRTKLSNAVVERVLGVPATTRNWKTVLALRDLARG